MLPFWSITMAYEVIEFSNVLLCVVVVLVLGKPYSCHVRENGAD